MAIAFDAAAHCAEPTDGQTAFSFNHVLGGGSNRVVIVGYAGRQGGAGCVAPTPTYNGTNMTVVNAQNWSAGSAWGAALWIIKEESLPAAGTYAVAVTFGNADIPASYGIVATSWTGVDQTTPISNATGAHGLDATPTLTVTSATDNLVITANNTKANSTFTCDGTERDRSPTTLGSGHAVCVIQTKPGAASVVMAPTSSQTEWSEPGASINVAAGATVDQYMNALDAQRNAPGVVGINHWWT